MIYKYGILPLHICKKSQIGNQLERALHVKSVFMFY